MSAVDAGTLEAALSTLIQEFRKLGWTVKKHPLNKGGFLVSFDTPDENFDGPSTRH